jgi:hypothetical protein
MEESKSFRIETSNRYVGRLKCEAFGSLSFQKRYIDENTNVFTADTSMFFRI